jgi:hypothetical protein
MEGLTEGIKPLLDSLIEHLPLIAGVVLTLWLGGWAVVRLALVYGERWKRNAKRYGGTRRFLRPKTWLRLQPAPLFKMQGELLKSATVVEFAAPIKHFSPERKEKGFYPGEAWRSPYREAVKASFRENEQLAQGKSGKHLRTRAQIARAAKWAVVKPLPEDVFIGGDQSKHCMVTIGLNKRRRNLVEALEEDVRSALDAQSIEPYASEEYDRVNFLVHLATPTDILIERKFGVEFFDENPAKDPYSLPLAVMENGKPWCLSLHHTLIYGMTGAGKGGPIQGTIRQLAPFVHKGTVKLYGIDPKGPELGAYAKKGVRMFERISIGLAEENIRQHVTTINAVAAIIAQRGTTMEPDFTEGQENLNRSVKATRETPWIVLFIDEYLTLVKGLKKLGKEGAAPLATLDQILATGRSFGIYVVLATQVATKEVFGDVRDNIPNAIVLKHKAGNYWTTEFLGEDALELGLDPKRIGPSNEDNGYETAGIGYVATPGGVVRVRFGYLSDKGIIEIAKQFMEPGADLGVFKEKTPVFDPNDYGLGPTAEELAEGGANGDPNADDDADDDGGFEVQEVPTGRADEFTLALQEFERNSKGKRTI